MPQLANRIQALLERAVHAEQRCIAVVGAGRSGVAAASALKAAGYNPLVIDENAANGWSCKRLEQLGVALIDRFDVDLHRNEIIRLAPAAAVLSPGVRGESHLIKALRALDIAAVSELDLACALFGAPSIAVSGTNGKSTILAILKSIYQCASREVRISGHGASALEVLAGGTRNEGEDWIIEVSSHQLEEAVDFAPQVAVMSSLGVDHLESHGSKDDYHRAKFRLLAAADTPGSAAIIDTTSTVGAEFAAKFNGRVVSVQANEGPGEATWFDRSTNKLHCRLSTGEFNFSLAQFHLIGAHNRINAAAAASAALCLGIAADAVQGGIKAVEVPPHHLQRLKLPGGRIVIDDSAAKNPEAASAALAAVFEVFKLNEVVLLVGGRMKEGNWQEWSELAAQCRGVICFGESGAELAKMIKAEQAALPADIRSAKLVEVASSLSPAVQVAFKESGERDLVLFSPGCSSFDEFSGFTERGEAFCSLARQAAAAD